MIQNTNMESKAVACTDVANDNSVLSKMERIYSKQRLLYVKLLEINSAMIGSEVCDIPEAKTNCEYHKLQYQMMQVNPSL